MEDEKKRLRKCIYYPIAISLLLWFIKSLELALSLDFGEFGILPRTLKGSTGIVLSGFIHGDVLHLISNTIPLVLLGVTILYFYDKRGYRIILGLYIITGCAVWLLARPAYHIGASGLVYAMLSFLFTGGLIRKDRQSLAISLVILVLYGGSMFSGLLPGNAHISWESHLIGFGFGILAAIYFRKATLITQIEIIDSNREIETNSNSTIDQQNNKTTFVYHYTEEKDLN